ncbi:dihydrofolate reductase [Clostridium perfringens]
MISIIVAMSENNVIGNNGKIPWKIKGEQKRFKDLTIGNTIIMGRKSFDEIGKPLPNRKTILISKTKKIIDTSCITVNSLKDALEITRKESEVFIAGGGQVYKDAMPYVDRIYLTVIHKNVDGDTFFPQLNKNDFKKTYEEYVDGEIPYTYYTYDRIK